MQGNPKLRNFNINQDLVEKWYSFLSPRKIFAIDASGQEQSLSKREQPEEKKKERRTGRGEGESCSSVRSTYSVRD